MNNVAAHIESTAESAGVCEDAISVVLMGAAPDTSNLGVSALSKSVVVGLSERLPNGRVTIFDFGRGLRQEEALSCGSEFRVFRYGSVNTRRLHRRESIYNMAMSAALGGMGHPGIKVIRESAAVLDISGGDSFSDIYGRRFFRSNTLRKRMALQLGAPLILLPQTYGPYTSPDARRIAERIVRSSAMAWARDQHSYDVLRELLGKAFDPTSHRLGVDVAFGLPVAEPKPETTDTIREWLAAEQTPVVGLNVSGLLMNRPETSRRQYGLKANYQDVILQLCQRLLKDTDARLLLVPHVVCPTGVPESDVDACGQVASLLQATAGERLSVCPVFTDPCEVKWVIGQCSWFCGTRMHSTIAALSMGVPTAAIAYSYKTLGVFETCNQGTHVADPRHLDTNEVVEHLLTSWNSREDATTSLRASLPSVRRQVREQMDAIVCACRERVKVPVAL